MRNIKVHSITDLITNSSTTIYTYSEKSESAMKNLVNEFFKAFGINKTCDNVFNLNLVPNDTSFYLGYLEDIPPELVGLKYQDRQKKIEEILEQVFSGKIKKPDWMQEIENDCGHSGSTVLNITAKEPQYEKLADLFYQFLYSTHSEEGEC